MSIFKNFFGDPNQKVVDKLKPTVEKINDLEKTFEKFSDADLKKKTGELKEEIGKKLERIKGEDKETIKKKEREILDNILPEAFALVREASKRVFKMRHFDVQIMGGIVLHEGKIAEMRTGEGKTLAATLPVFLNALAGKGVHVVTVNDYLAKRDAGWMGEIYNFLGLTIACIVHEKSFILDKSFKNEDIFDERIEHLKECSRKEAYAADITYGTNNEFGFDYLRDNMVQNIGQMAQRGHHYAIVDEVDSILIDEARTPLIISAPAEESTEKYYEFAKIVSKLAKDKDYEIDEKMNAATLTSEGIQRLEVILGVQNIYEEKGIDTVHHIEQALKAHALFKKDRDYVEKDGEIIIVDEFTGRLMPGRRYSEGLHQAIEAKEGVEIKRESLTMATISFQNYFRMYDKLSGMTGTAETEAEEFHKIYKLDVVVIPTNHPMIREDKNDLIFKTEMGKFKAVANEIKERNKKGQPVLVGTVSIEKNELLSGMLKREGIKHEVLNAKNHEKEAAIISEAGEKGAVTVATNMAGRGTDIVLGDGVKEIGGLLVIGTERHESRRIDNQLRGRTGRQGDPGSSQFYVSLDDDLMRIFGSERVGGLMEKLGLPEDQAIEHSLISKSLESAQTRVEGNNFDIRKHLVEYDDVMNKQRETIYKRRRNIIESEFAEDKDKENIKNEILDMFDAEIDYMIDSHINPETREVELENVFQNLTAMANVSDKSRADFKKLEVFEIKEKSKKLVFEKYEEKEKETGTDLMRILERASYLRTMDMLWVDHLDAMGHLREGIGLRGYGQKDPLIEYKNESYNMFQKLLLAIRQEIVYSIFKISIQRNEPVNQKEERSPENVILETGRMPESDSGPSSAQLPPTQSFGRTSWAGRQARMTNSEASPSNQPIPSNPQDHKVGRNDPCPCGSGKKYKKCCGRK
ncbi:preprotein translocase subunit SecA [bacterium (Candidatus Howlettbacteria) CG_4_10_14_0_8_um_filter_40_9]|nr:MAG: preprotein translocase subunit SecA [bacterium (Candidatus Howlettbacteria) CG_4_10_14_0_8_um_filter_40_9]